MVKKQRGGQSAAIATNLALQNPCASCGRRRPSSRRARACRGGERTHRNVSDFSPRPPGRPGSIEGIAKPGHQPQKVPPVSLVVEDPRSPRSPGPSRGGAPRGHPVLLALAWCHPSTLHPLCQCNVEPTSRIITQQIADEDVELQFRGEPVIVSDAGRSEESEGEMWRAWRRRSRP